MEAITASTACRFIGQRSGETSRIPTYRASSEEIRGFASGGACAGNVRIRRSCMLSRRFVGKTARVIRELSQVVRCLVKDASPAAVIQFGRMDNVGDPSRPGCERG